MAGEVVNIEACNPLNRSKAKLMTEGNKLCSGLTENYHSTERSELMSYKRIICHYSYNLPLAVIVEQHQISRFKVIKAIP